MHSNFTIVLISIIALAGCDGSFTNTVDIDRSDFESKGVVFSLLSNVDSRDSAFHEQSYGREKQGSLTHNRIYISNSYPSSKAENQFYQGWVILRSEQKDLTLQYHDQHTSNQETDPYFAVMSPFQPGEIYHLIAGTNNQESGSDVKKWPKVTAVDTMPMPVSIELENAYIQYPDLEETLAKGYVDIKIEDEVDRRNYYQIEISVIQKISKVNGHDSQLIIPATIQGTEDKVSSEVFGKYDHNLIYEAEFNRQGRKQIHFSFHSNHSSFNKQKSVILLVRLSNLSDNCVRFFRSSRQYFSIGENPLTEPIEIYSNIENGYGIFAFATRSYAEIIVR